MVEEGLEIAFAQGTCVVTRPDRSCVAKVDEEGGQYILRGLELDSLDAQLTSRGTRRADDTEPDRSNEHRVQGPGCLEGRLQEDKEDQGQHSQDTHEAEGASTALTLRVHATDTNAHARPDANASPSDDGYRGEHRNEERDAYSDDVLLIIKDELNISNGSEQEGVKNKITHRYSPLGLEPKTQDGGARPAAAVDLGASPCGHTEEETKEVVSDAFNIDAAFKILTETTSSQPRPDTSTTDNLCAHQEGARDTISIPTLARNRIKHLDIASKMRAKELTFGYKQAPAAFNFGLRMLRFDCGGASLDGGHRGW
ncbi:hypothetical protein V8E36_004421 [Tilletia maclaganii]